MDLLKASHISVAVGGKRIINDLSLTITSGAIHILQGANGSGKSSLALAIMGHPRYEITAGTLFFEECDITQLPVHERAKLGIFLSFQQPPEIPGVTVFTFLLETYAALIGQKISLDGFQQLLNQYLDQLSIDPSFMQRSVHAGFSGGEKKRLEALQLLLFKPKLAILDELDSGLDSQALNQVMNAIQLMRKENPQFSALIITHYEKTLELLQPDVIHEMQKGSVHMIRPADQERKTKTKFPDPDQPKVEPSAPGSRF